jgi:hypothetical protein
MLPSPGIRIAPRIAAAADVGCWYAAGRLDDDVQRPGRPLAIADAAASGFTGVRKIC